MQTGRPPQQPLLLLSDVDGTLLGEHGELPAPPAAWRAALDALATRWPGPVYVGLASSRTLRELTVLQRALGLRGPLIAEDGARHAVDMDLPVTLNTPPASTERHGRRVLLTWQHAVTSQTLREHFNEIDPFRRADTHAESVDALRRLGFRSTGAIRRAIADRTHSVLLDPTQWSPDELADLQRIAAARSLHLRRGGRWFTLTGSGGKGPAVRALRHQAEVTGVPALVVAIGNEENDESLLAEADRRFVIRNPHRGPHPVLSALPDAVVLDRVGVGGWMEMLDRLSRDLPAAHVASTGARVWR